MKPLGWQSLVASVSHHKWNECQRESGRREPAPLLLGFVLGPMMEVYMRRTMLLSGGDASVFLTSPISLGLLIAAAIVLVIVLIPTVNRRRAEVFVEED